MKLLKNGRSISLKTKLIGMSVFLVPLAVLVVGSFSLLQFIRFGEETVARSSSALESQALEILKGAALLERGLRGGSSRKFC